MTDLFTYEEIDRAIFEHIRLGVVEAGYLPDINLSATESLWIAARDALRASLPDKELIEVFGVSTSDDREEYTTSKILINRTDEMPGIVAGGGVEYEAVSNGFIQQKVPTSSTDITYEVIFNASSVKYERIISNILNKKFGKRAFLASMGTNGQLNPDKPFYFQQIQKFDSSAMLFLQKTLIFKVTGIFLSAESETITDSIVPINSITFTIQSTHTEGSPSDDLGVTIIIADT